MRLQPSIKARSIRGAVPQSVQYMYLLDDHVHQSTAGPSGKRRGREEVLLMTG